jgi:hypothetical protein
MGASSVFASNRHAYQEPLAPDARERLVADPSFFVDLYRLELATGELVQLTTAPGYDGGPFFSADGSRSHSGASARTGPERRSSRSTSTAATNGR